MCYFVDHFIWSGCHICTLPFSTLLKLLSFLPPLYLFSRWFSRLGTASIGFRVTENGGIEVWMSIVRKSSDDFCHFNLSFFSETTPSGIVYIMMRHFVFIVAAEDQTRSQPRPRIVGSSTWFLLNIYCYWKSKIYFKNSNLPMIKIFCK